MYGQNWWQIVTGLTHSLEEYASSRRLSSLRTDSIAMTHSSCHMSLLLALYGVTTILTASQWIYNIYDNRVNCRCIGYASLIHTNFSFEQQDDHCPNRSTTPLPMWYIVSPPSPKLPIDSQQSEPLPPWRGMQLSPPLFISCVALSCCWWGKWKYKWWKWKWWASSTTWNAKLPLPKGLQIVKWSTCSLCWSHLVLSNSSISSLQYIGLALSLLSFSIM